MAKPRIRWFVHAGGQLLPRTRGMRGTWGFDATCECGWSSRTGGGTERSVRRKVADHLLFAHDVETSGLWR